MDRKKIVIGSRGSPLALWQSEHVAGLLGRDNTEIKIFKTRGDKIRNVSFEKMEGKGFFTKEIEDALLDHRIDLAVHSLKDLPTDGNPALRIAAVPQRANPADMLLIRHGAFDKSRTLQVRKAAVIGTSSLRRLAQLKNIDDSISIKPLRGNVDSRLRKLLDDRYDAIVLACAGIMRLGLDIADLIPFELPFDMLLPAPAQGALGLQIRKDDPQTDKAVAPLDHNDTRRAVTAEREFLHYFGGGCHVPLGARAVVENGRIRLTGVIASTDGKRAIRETVSAVDPGPAGKKLADILKNKGALDLI